MNTERVEAAAKALRELEGEKQTPWEELDYRIKTVWIGRALAAITAADAASGEKVVYTATESTLFAKVFQGAPAGSSFFVQSGHEVVVRKVRGT